jgi:hypothetical protein
VGPDGCAEVVKDSARAPVEAGGGGQAAPALVCMASAWAWQLAGRAGGRVDAFQAGVQTAATKRVCDWL